MSFPPIAGIELVEVLGEGFGGTVYRGVRASDGTSVAVKVLTVSEIDPLYGEKFNRLIREAEIYGAVGHPNLVPFLGHSLETSPPYLVFEVLAGGDLATRIRERGPLEPEALRRLGVRMAAALAALHAAGIFHRDVKAANVLLGAEDVPYLCDLGIGHLLDAGRLTASNIVLGTPVYMAPEVLSGGPSTAQSDLFSLGVLLAFAATGSLPTREEAGLDRSWEDELDPGYAPLLPVIRLCLRDHPDHRPKDAAWVVERLEQVDLENAGHASSRDDTATHTFEFATSKFREAAAPPPADSPSESALVSEAIVDSPTRSTVAAPARTSWARPFFGAMLGMLLALLWHVLSQVWFFGRLPVHARGLLPDSTARSSDPEATGATWELPDRQDTQAGVRLLLETPGQVFEFRDPAGGEAETRIAWDSQGAVLEIDGGDPRGLMALSPAGTLLWIREIQGEWRLHPGWVSVQLQGATTWIERQTGRIVGP